MDTAVRRIGRPDASVTALSKCHQGPTIITYAENMVQCAFWTHADFEKMKLKNNGVYDKFIAIIGCDLVRKLKHRNDQQLDLITKLDFVI